ncbi:MAG: hypothetical protein ABI175_16650, partial [Polyangiales bacterium]
GGATATAPGADSNDGRYRDGDGADDADEEDAAPRSKKDVASAPDSYDRAESITLGGAVGSSLTMAPRSVLGRGFRASIGLGGGLVLQDQQRDPAIAMNLRIEAGRGRSLFGAEGSLWLVDGLHGQGRVLASFARVGIAHYLELGIGFGAHFGAGIGPAGAFSLRLHLPPAPWVAAYLRYDGALLVQPDDSRQGQNTMTGGLEWGF